MVAVHAFHIAFSNDALNTQITQHFCCTVCSVHTHTKQATIQLRIAAWCDENKHKEQKQSTSGESNEKKNSFYFLMNLLHQFDFIIFPLPTEKKTENFLFAASKMAFSFLSFPFFYYCFLTNARTTITNNKQ